MADRVRLRLIALLSLGAFGVHQGRYLSAYGEHAGAELEAQGHSYLEMVGPLIGVLLVAAIGSFAMRLVRGSAAYDGRWTLARGWAIATTSLLSVFVVQESVEGMLFAGHPGGVDAVLGSGGWSALPLAIVIGGLIAWAMREAQRVLRRRAAAPGVLRLWLPLAPVAPYRSAVVRVLRSAGLARNLAGRGPPGLLTASH